VRRLEKKKELEYLVSVGDVLDSLKAIQRKCVFMILPIIGDANSLINDMRANSEHKTNKIIPLIQ
jgi:hypothetical protein